MSRQSRFPHPQKACSVSPQPQNTQPVSLTFLKPFPGPHGQLLIMLVKHTEPIEIPRLPWLCLPAEMQDRRVLHDPFGIILSGTAHHIIIIISGIIIPEGVIHRQDPLPVHGIQKILIRKHQFYPMLVHIPENFFRQDFLPRARSISSTPEL